MLSSEKITPNNVLSPSAWSQSIAAAVISLLVLYTGWYFSGRPLWHTDLWGHLALGRMIQETKSLPAREVFLLAPDNRQVVDTAWLSQVLAYKWERLAGVGGLQLLYGTMVAGLAGGMLLTFWKQTRLLWLALLGTAAFFWLEWEQLKIIRPQLAGVLFFTLLWCRFQFPLTMRLVWWIPPLLAVWANLHGSFIMGVGLVGCVCLGRILDLLRAGLFSRWKQDQELSLLFVLTLLAIASPLLNPYGAGLYKTVLTFSGDPNLYDLIEWQPLSFKMRQGKAAAAILLLLVVLWRFSRQRIASKDILLLLVLGAATLLTSRMIIWWAPVAATQIVTHLQVLHSRFAGDCSRTGIQVQSSAFSRGSWLASGAILLTGMLFVASRLNYQHLETLFSESPARSEKVVSASTPVALAMFLRQHRQALSQARPPQQLRLFHTMEWGDYFIWSVGAQQPVFVYSHVHLIPRETWLDYRAIARCGSDWKQRLDKYQIDTIALQKSRQPRLVQQLEKSVAWKVIYQDPLGIVFSKQKSGREQTP